jgi:hypothetical protein
MFGWIIFQLGGFSTKLNSILCKKEKRKEKGKPVFPSPSSVDFI